MLSLGYNFKASIDIEIGEDFFLGLQKIIVCGKCKDEMDFYDQCTKKSKKYCETVLICLQCYDKSQIKLKKTPIMFRCHEWKCTKM
jgi:hypothetical protein